MFISHKKKLIFFRVTKTGSTTMQFCLWMSGAVGKDDIASASIGGFTRQGVDKVGDYGIAHLTPTELIEQGIVTLDQLREYDCYGFVREPARRFLSGSIHIMPRHVTVQEFQDVAWDIGKITNHPKILTTRKLINRKQSDYFFVGDEQVVTPLNFSNYEAEARFLIKRAGGIDLPHIPRMNVRAGWHADLRYDDFWTPELAAMINEVYADDVALYNTMKEGKNQ